MAPYTPVRSLWPATDFFVPAGYRLPRGKTSIDRTQQRNKEPIGWRFRKRIRIVKGLWINLSKRGGSLSVGGHGLTANISKKGVRETVGLPGSGISYQTRRVGTSHARRPARAPRKVVSPARFLALIAITVIILWILAHLH